MNGGKIGIGTTSPGSALTVNGAIAALGTNPEDIRLFMHTSHYGCLRTLTTNAGKLPLYFQQQDSSGTTIPVGIDGTGRMGIGTTNPKALLDVRGGLNINDGSGAAVITFGASGSYPNLYIRADDDPSTYESQSERVFIGGNGNVGIGTTAPSKKLTVRGNILVERSDGTSVIELGEGLDYAEGFDVAGDKATVPGTVLIIDTNNPGQLAMSTKAYDTRVAGIVAGARGLGSGVRLGVGQSDCDVALAGRVYCNVDATEFSVQPGDLLTTSATAGFAMKALDTELARGAILGKAMEGLEKGRKGQILVLVTLQ